MSEKKCPPHIVTKNRVYFVRALFRVGILALICLFIEPPTAIADSTYGGSLSLSETRFLAHPNPELNTQVSKLNGKLEFQKRFLESHKLKFLALGELSPDNKSPSERGHFNIQEAYYGIKRDAFDFQLGINVFNWGVTDGVNPMDVLNSRKLFDPLDAEKIGAPSLALKLKGDSSSFEVVYIPYQMETALPGTHSRWLPRDVFRAPVSSSTYKIILPKDEVQYSYLEKIEKTSALRDNVGVRLQSHFGESDLSLIGFYGAPSPPAFFVHANVNVVSVSPLISVSVDKNIRLQPVYYRTKLTGVSLVTTLPLDIILRAETVYSQSEDPGGAVPDWAHESVVEFERTFNIGSQTLTTIFEVTSTRRPEGYSSLSFSQILDRALIVAFRWVPSDPWQISFFSAADSKDYSNFTRLELNRQFSDFWKAQLRLERIEGAPDSSLSSYNTNSNALLKLIRQW